MEQLAFYEVTGVYIRLWHLQLEVQIGFTAIVTNDDISPASLNVSLGSSGGFVYLLDIDMLRVNRICRALGIELSDLLGESNLEHTLKNWFNDPEDEEEVQERLYRQQLFYPKPTESPYTPPFSAAKKPPREVAGRRRANEKSVCSYSLLCAKIFVNEF